MTGSRYRKTGWAGQRATLCDVEAENRRPAGTEQNTGEAPLVVDGSVVAASGSPDRHSPRSRHRRSEAGCSGLPAEIMGHGQLGRAADRADSGIAAPPKLSERAVRGPFHDCIGRK